MVYIFKHILKRICQTVYTPNTRSQGGYVLSTDNQ